MPKMAWISFSINNWVLRGFTDKTGELLYDAVINNYAWKVCKKSNQNYILSANVSLFFKQHPDSKCPFKAI